VCPRDKTKTAEIKIAKLGTWIVYRDTSPPMNIRPKVNFRVKVRVRRLSGRGELCTSILSAHLVIIPPPVGDAGI